MILNIDYGADGLEIVVPDSAIVLEMAAGPGLDDVDACIDAALARPIGTPALRQFARGRKNACVVIADITRPVPNATILPPMLRILEEAGIARENITILVGTGLHRPNEGAELVQLVGAAIARDYRIVNHMAREVAKVVVATVVESRGFRHSKLIQPSSRTTPRFCACSAHHCAASSGKCSCQRGDRFLLVCAAKKRQAPFSGSDSVRPQQS